MGAARVKRRFSAVVDSAADEEEVMKLAQSAAVEDIRSGVGGGTLGPLALSLASPPPLHNGKVLMMGGVEGGGETEDSEGGCQGARQAYDNGASYDDDGGEGGMGMGLRRAVCPVVASGNGSSGGCGGPSSSATPSPTPPPHHRRRRRQRTGGRGGPRSRFVGKDGRCNVTFVNMSERGQRYLTGTGITNTWIIPYRIGSSYTPLGSTI